jgi:hypothetical protein
MPAKVFLSVAQKKNLQKALKESECHHVRERILMFLLLKDGKTYQEISEFLGCAYRSVTYWRVHGDPDNLETIRDGREKGTTGKQMQLILSY